MKVKNLIENVVDFAQAREKRQTDAIRSQTAKNLSNDHETPVDNDAESLTVHELAEFEEYMATAKKKGRVPGFETIDDVIYYLLRDIQLPQHITRAKAIQWFQKLSEEEREQVRMLAHHSDRMIQVFDVLRTKLHGIQNTWYDRFNGKPPKGWDALDGASFLDSEFSYDINQLKNLKKAISILGH